MKSGSMVRISTATGAFVVEILNDFGPIADELAAEIEAAVLERLAAHRHLAREMSSVDIQRATFDYESRRHADGVRFDAGEPADGDDQSSAGVVVDFMLRRSTATT